jgi:hypothetical protein
VSKFFTLRFVILSGKRIPSQAIWRVIVLIILCTAGVSAFAQHPYLWLDSTELALMRSKVASNSADWQELQATCNAIAGMGSTPYAIMYQNPVTFTGSNDRGYVFHPSRAPQILWGGIGGIQWDTAIEQLGACYQALASSDPATSAAILEEAHYIITAMAQPLLTVVRQSDGVTRYGVSVAANGTDLTAGAQPQFYQSYGSYKAGDVLTITGATGCTNLNGTFEVQSYDGVTYFLETTSGKPAPTLNANCTLYSMVPTAGQGFPARGLMPAIAKAYDWFYNGLSANYPTDLTNLVAAMTAWATELQYVAWGNHPGGNYAAGDIWGATAAYVAFNSDQPSAIGTPAKNVLIRHFYGGSLTLAGVTTTFPEQFAQYNNLWLGGGGNGEGLKAYGYDSINRVLQAEYAMFIYKLTSGGKSGADWRSAPSSLTLLDDNLQYFMEFITPGLLSLDGNEDVFEVGQSYYGALNGSWFPTEPVYVPLDQTVFMTTMAARMSSLHATQFQNFYNSVSAAEKAAAGPPSGLVPAWANGGLPYQSSPEPQSTFLWYNPNAASRTWYDRRPLMYRAWGGNYATTRSAWNDADATLVRFQASPTVGPAGGGHTQFDSGAVTIQTGNNRLLVYGLEEAVRSADIISDQEWTKLAAERTSYGNKKNSIWWCSATASDTTNQGPTSELAPPGLNNTVTSFPSSISLAEDEEDFTYFEGTHMEANAAKDPVDHQYHQVAWTRQVFFLRPKLVIVHDRTTALYPTDDRSMFWTFGREIAQVTANIPSGMTRYDASFKGTYRGAFWSVLPASANVNIVDHDDLHFLYRAEVRPTVMNHTNDNWLAVFDAASSPEVVNNVSAVQATNADAVQFNDSNSTIVAFANVDPHVMPNQTLSWAINASSAQYIAGLTPEASYGISVETGQIVVSATGAYRASSAGVLAIQSEAQRR